MTRNYDIKITNQEWKKVGHELSTTKATLVVTDTYTGEQTKQSLKAEQGC